ncbi:MAG: pyridoxamine kinase [Erysipelotrichaceae bacterium]|nr:pyridoxamine kinase [Erysipelotrichaceae bacterium]MDD4643376.1 pyridoxamine kinase [Erysipelotrichaceae bacterium]
MKQKRIVAIHDISCFGKCSLTVALPIISAAGIEVSVIPTAVLSTHTGGFTGFTFRDLTDDIVPILDHWANYDIQFDGIYTGYLGSFEQIELMKQTFDRLRTENTIVFVDPVMADNGKLYPLFPQDFPKGMRSLCEKADVIIPNITEACFMLDKEYEEGPYTKEYIEELIRRLSFELNVKRVVLTGVYFDDQKLGAAAYDQDQDKIEYAMSDRITGYYHGTGDVFASAVMASMLSNKSLKDAIEIAVDFTVESIKRTKEANTDVKFGVDFETGLKKLASQLNDK